MDDQPANDQARTISALMFRLMRQLAVSDDDDLIAELPLGQLRVCGILHHGPRPMSEISRELRVSHSAMTQIADRLERAELVERVAEGSDRRVRRLQLTPRGREIMERREETRIGRIAAALDELSAKKRKDVSAALETFLGACAASARQEVPLSLSKAIS
jgi:DNA-binding MarR family transcriptional regulator